MYSGHWWRSPGALTALLGLSALLALSACERAREAAPADTAEPISLPADTALPPLPQTTWDLSAGPALLVRGSEPGQALVVLPEYADSTLPDTLRLDAAAVRGAVVDIFSRGGVVGQARVTDVRGTTWTGDDCIEWPQATMRPLTVSRVASGALGALTPPPARSEEGTPVTPDTSSWPAWTVAFVGGRVQAIALDSIETLVRADSARLAAEATRLASLLPNDTATAFRGIPFAVRTAYRFSAADGAEVLVADVLRKVNLEANPLEEHILLIAERDPRARAEAGRYRSVYSERASGTEEGIETSEVLAAVRLGGTRGALVLSRQGYESSAYSLLERTAPGQWRVRWTSVHTGC